MSHYFTDPKAAEVRRSVEVRFWDTDWRFTTANEVFSADGLDLGTAVLLRSSAPPADATRLLDLGCGWGVLAVALATACPSAVVDAVDAAPTQRAAAEALGVSPQNVSQALAASAIAVERAVYPVLVRLLERAEAP